MHILARAGGTEENSRCSVAAGARAGHFMLRCPGDKINIVYEFNTAQGEVSDFRQLEAEQHYAYYFTPV